MNWLRSQKIDTIAQALRQNAWNPQPLLTKLGKPILWAALPNETVRWFLIGEDAKVPHRQLWVSSDLEMPTRSEP